MKTSKLLRFSTFLTSLLLACSLAPTVASASVTSSCGALCTLPPNTLTINKIAEGAPDDLMFDFTLYGFLPEGGLIQSFSLENGGSKEFSFAPAVMAWFVTEEVSTMPAGWSLTGVTSTPSTIASLFPLAIGGSVAWGGASSFSDVAPDYGLLPADVRGYLVETVEGHLPANGALGGCLGVGCSFDVTFTNEVPLPAAAWLFGSGLIALAGLKRRKR